MKKHLFDPNSLVNLSISPQINAETVHIRTLRDSARNTFFKARGLGESELNPEGAQANGVSGLYLDTSNLWHKHCADLANQIKQTVGRENEGALTRYVAWNALVGGGNPDHVCKERDLPGEPIIRFFQEQWAASLTKDGLRNATEGAMRPLADHLAARTDQATTPHKIPSATTEYSVNVTSPTPPAKTRPSAVTPNKQEKTLQVLGEVEQLHQRAAQAFVARYELSADQTAQLVEHLTQKRGVPLDSSDPKMSAAFDGFVRERQSVLEKIKTSVPHVDEHAAYQRLKGHATTKASRVDTSRGQIIKTLKEWVDGLENNIDGSTQENTRPGRPSGHQR